MPYRVRLSSSATTDAEEGYLWLQRSASERRAFVWYNGLADAVNSLAEMPGRCPTAPEADEPGIELRQLLYGKRSAAYRILFVLIQDGGDGDGLVYVFRIWHGARDRIRQEDLEPGL